MLQCGTDDDDDEQLKIELLSQWKLEAEFRKNSIHIQINSTKICRYSIFSPEIRKYRIFVAKICKHAFIDSFEGFAVVIDNSAS